jgi:hypothetical protein
MRQRTRADGRMVDRDAIHGVDSGSRTTMCRRITNVKVNGEPFLDERERSRHHLGHYHHVNENHVVKVSQRVFHINIYSNVSQLRIE